MIRSSPRLISTFYDRLFVMICHPGLPRWSLLSPQLHRLPEIFQLDTAHSIALFEQVRVVEPQDQEGQHPGPHTD
jgi:hypothetical protein